MRVLVVDDERDIRTLIARVLAPHAICDQAGDGVEGLALFAALVGTPQRYDLVVLDILMPCVDGKGFLVKARALEAKLGLGRVEGVKILMLTAMDGNRFVIGSFRQGCDSYLVKPFDPEDLLREVRAFGLLPPASAC
jgi:DNA-binding response OmpR family regulator